MRWLARRIDSWTQRRAVPPPGLRGHGLKQILAGANAPFGSLYHFFPGGKEQLGAETIRSSGQLYIELFATIAAQAPDVPTRGGRLLRRRSRDARETAYADACPIATVALEVSSTNEQLREACAEVFDGWIAGATSYFRAAGIQARDRARAGAQHAVPARGRFLFCRALRSTEPLRVAGASAVAATPRGARRRRLSTSRRLRPVEASLLLDGPLGPWDRFEAGVGDRLAAVDRKAVGAVCESLFGALDRGELIAHTLELRIGELVFEHLRARVGLLEWIGDFFGVVWAQLR